MLYDAHEVAVGETVFLFPHTKTASRICHEQKAVKVAKAPSAHWPMVLVTWTEGDHDRWQMVHKDDIKKRPPNKTAADKKLGDSLTDRNRAVARVRVMPGKKIEVMDDQMELF